MRKFIGFYVYGLSILLVFELISLLSTPNPQAIFRTVLALVVTVLVIKGYRVGIYSRLKFGALYYGFWAFGALLIALLLQEPLWYIILGILIFGSYSLGFSATAKALKRENDDIFSNKIVTREFESSEDYTEYKGITIKKSTNYYWIGELRFTNIKEAEAYIENSFLHNTST